MKKAVIIVGARPNFMKAAPIIRAMKKDGSIKPVLIHTGQHYDKNMSDAFFKDLKMPKPDVFLGVGSGSHAEQTAKVMVALETELQKIKPNVVIVVGDVNSTVAGALTAKKLNIKVAHVEAGLRSFDETMPEEINRIVTDHIADFLFTTEVSGNTNLIHEGILKKKVHFVGNVMIDSLLGHKKNIAESKIIIKLKLRVENYAVLTLHRPSNVDNKKNLKNILEALIEIQKTLTIVFPMHPRTKKQIEIFKLEKTFQKCRNMVLIEPLGYTDFTRLVRDAKLVLTDSGGLQEETTVQGVSCITIRENTERPITLTKGTNVLVGSTKEEIMKAFRKIKKSKKTKGSIPKYWDGKAAERIVKILKKKL
ncbi:MAG: UDP-N-acetylglucosamine 2-epimerase (non-hydrolyzing) [Candidatus Harrisonbacteria bacterium CG10_big_fil_rev_8_21_14_0_10_42_17]|uniref:UDP-N-acetylglucosamine 2-epimerase (Non-hydrolyzing) n=1 Tax=Candidatus Harrisonbacteria bacterium CG10_big_fil_rev_8_21_14_0_10_42_17 TaxID=1974584 RepID=A0A2M6WI23_9BACT|nr:MAG: UDP-N-acetylglucosamine 2-epimerase (non-hydrolyzing) [Candidatus Harrisonbacteria bacterium CG10_big_fil_rev_8_21_14_0_10_42_17]